MIDAAKAMLYPTMVFKDPRDVVADNDFTRDQKVKILRRWEYGARQLEVAGEEAGMAVRRPEMFGRIVQALHVRGVERDTEHTPRQDSPAESPRPRGKVKPSSGSVLASSY